MQIPQYRALNAELLHAEFPMQIKELAADANTKLIDLKFSAATLNIHLQLNC